MIILDFNEPILRKSIEKSIPSTDIYSGIRLFSSSYSLVYVTNSSFPFEWMQRLTVLESESMEHRVIPILTSGVA